MFGICRIAVPKTCKKVMHLISCVMTAVCLVTLRGPDVRIAVRCRLCF